MALCLSWAGASAPAQLGDSSRTESLCDGTSIGSNLFHDDFAALRVAERRGLSISELRRRAEHYGRDPERVLFAAIGTLKEPEHVAWLRVTWQEGAPSKQTLPCFVQSLLPGWEMEPSGSDLAPWRELLKELARNTVSHRRGPHLTDRTQVQWVLLALVVRFDDGPTSEFLRGVPLDELTPRELAVVVMALRQRGDVEAHNRASAQLARCAGHLSEVEVACVARISRSATLVPPLVKRLSQAAAAPAQLLGALHAITLRFDIERVRDWERFAETVDDSVPRSVLLAEAVGRSSAQAAIRTGIVENREGCATDPELLGPLLQSDTLDASVVMLLLAGYNSVFRDDYVALAQRVLQDERVGDLNSLARSRLEVLAGRKRMSWREYIGLRKEQLRRRAASTVP